MIPARGIAFLSHVDRLPLCEQSEVTPGKMLRVHLEGMGPILVCNVSGTFHAVDDECTHAIASLSEGRLQGRIVFCPMHGGSFDVCSGMAMSLPCKQPLRTWPLEVTDGKVYLLLKR
jgi:nitrite reductase/ring-hydroxylating ferredoxin subunit